MCDTYYYFFFTALGFIFEVLVKNETALIVHIQNLPK